MKKVIPEKQIIICDMCKIDSESHSSKFTHSGARCKLSTWSRDGFGNLGGFDLNLDFCETCADDLLKFLDSKKT